MKLNETGSSKYQWELWARWCSSYHNEVFLTFLTIVWMEAYFQLVIKLSYVVSIFKSGERKDIKNYRQIGIQSPVAKVFVLMVLDQLKSFFN